ncbi:MAG: pyridoxamine 5'-phosphate oxidase family protein [Actinomycetota bacterium]|nr:pyridoxamine 5'-phosphate oxidase family protein [Actinomycetota bacterium]
MHEMPEDVARLQRLLDASYASAGTHLRSIFTPDRVLRAERLPELLGGVRVLDLATVNAQSEPRVAPVDGLFYRGQFWFGSSPESIRFRHIRNNPAVSASHTRGEELAVIVHGTARIVDLASSETAGFRDYCGDIYGTGWSDWGAGAQYARIDARKMFTFWNPAR